MIVIKLHFLDFVLIGTLGYLIYDVVDHSTDYSSCCQPINYWLLAVYITLLLLRLCINIVINSDNSFLVQFFRYTLIFFIIPFLFEWTVQGTLWYLDISKETPDCIPSERLPPLIIWWLFLCYIDLAILFGIMIYELICFLKKRRVRALIENYLNSNDPYRDIDFLNSLIEGGELNPDDIPLSKVEFNRLQISNFYSLSIVQYQCSICCEDIKNGEHIIKLIGCGHVFHRNCLELWLERKPLCPNCKRNIRNDIFLKYKNDSDFFQKKDTANGDEFDAIKSFTKGNELEEEKT